MDWTEGGGEDLQAVYNWGSGGRDALCFVLGGSIKGEEEVNALYKFGGWLAMRRGK